MWECGSDRKGQKVNKGYGLAKKLSGSFIHLFKIINASWRNSRTKYIVTKCEGSEVLPYLYAIKLACHRFILMEAGRRQGWGQRNVSFVAQLAAPISHRTRENGPGGCCLYSIYHQVPIPHWLGLFLGHSFCGIPSPLIIPPYLVARASPDQNVELALTDNFPFFKLSLR